MVNFNDTRIDALENFVKLYLDTALASGYQSRIHGFSHMKWVADKTAEYLKDEDASLDDQKLGYIAGLFHDIVRPQPKLLKPGDKAPEVQSAAIAVKELKKLGFSAHNIEVVENSILCHSFGVEFKGNRTDLKKSNDLITLCLQAADKGRQFLPSIIEDRKVFIEESIDNPTKEQVIEYWKRRLVKTEEFASTPAGKILLKHEPDLLAKFAVVKKYFHEHVSV